MGESNFVHRNSTFSYSYFLVSHIRAVKRWETFWYTVCVISRNGNYTRDGGLR
jgi:hypothetical protein